MQIGCDLPSSEPGMAAHILIGSTKVVEEEATATLGDDEPDAGVGQQQGGRALYWPSGCSAAPR